MNPATTATLATGAFSGVDVGKMIVFGEPAYNQVMHFLIQEAKALDELRADDWLAMLDDDLFYHMPLRRTTLRAEQQSYHEQTNWFHETKPSIAFKLMRVTESGSAWADDPATRVRRFVSNLTLYDTNEKDTYLAESYIMVSASRGNQHAPDIISARRDDVLRREGDGFRLLRRTILSDYTVLGIPSLPFFF